MVSKVMHGFIVVVLLTAMLIAGDTGKISGRVTDEETGTPMAGVNIIITSKWINDEEVPLANPTGAATDIEGRFFVLNLAPGKYTVRAQCVGYTTKIRTKVEVSADKSTRVDFKLTPQAIQGEEVVVTAFRKDIVQPDLTATRQSYEINEIQDDIGISNINDIIGLQSGVVDDHFRGGRSGEAKFLLGGAGIVDPLTNGKAFSPKVAGLQAVDVYTSGFSAEYGNAQSGVINMVPREGQSEWRSRLEFSMVLPYYKTFEERFNSDSSAYYQGGSLYSPHNVDFYNLLMDTTEWLKDDPFNPGHALFDRGYGYGGKYVPFREWGWPPPPVDEIARILHQDSLRAGAYAMIAMMQAFDDVGLEYDQQNTDYEMNFSTGGPLSENTRLFFAISQDTDNEIVPTPYPEWNRQLMTNLTYRPSRKDKLLFRFFYNKEFDNHGYWKRMWFDPELGVSKTYNTSRQYGFDWTHIFNNSNFMDLKFNILDLKAEEGIELLRDGEVRDDYTASSNWTYYYGPNQDIRIGQSENDKGIEKTTTYQFHGKFTSQITNSHMLKSGIEFSYFDIDVDRDENLSSLGGYRQVVFKKNPYEGALYLEDKMEFEGLVANVGFRFDFYDFNSDFYSDIYSPLRNPDYSDSANVPYYSREYAAMEEATLKTRLEPRIGISFPVSDKTVFHLNYGSFMQRPGFNQILYNRITVNDDIEEIGNMRLDPQVTNSYDIGIVKSFPFGFHINLSAYYKDVKDLIERAYFRDTQQIQYATFVNRDYADIKGFHIDLERKTGRLRGYVRYNWESAKGKSSNAFNAPVTFFEEPDPKYGSADIPDPEDIFLDFDRTHKIVCQLKYYTSSSAGFTLFGIKPLADISVTGRYRAMSGRPYTWDETGKGLRMNQRTPWEHDLRLRVQKSIKTENNSIRIYAEGYNLLNEIEWHYNNTFTTGHEAYTRWHTDRKEVLTNKEWAPYVVSQEIYLLDNEPRHFELGIIIEY